MSHSRDRPEICEIVTRECLKSVVTGDLEIGDVGVEVVNDGGVQAGPRDAGRSSGSRAQRPVP